MGKPVTLCLSVSVFMPRVEELVDEVAHFGWVVFRIGQVILAMSIFLFSLLLSFHMKYKPNHQILV